MAESETASARSRSLFTQDSFDYFFAKDLIKIETTSIVLIFQRMQLYALTLCATDETRYDRVLRAIRAMGFFDFRNGPNVF